MNLLAHLYLSGTSEHIITGNFIGDYVKGNQYNNYPQGIKDGILLHRHIDTFTDTHQIVRRSINHLMPEFHKYSGIIVDIFYDHFLSKDWHHFSEEPLDRYTNKIHRILEKNRNFLPSKVHQFLPDMKSSKWLEQYNTLSGISIAIERLVRRAHLPGKIKQASGFLSQYYEAFHTEFYMFFPQLINYVRQVHHIDIQLPNHSKVKLDQHLSPGAND